MKGLKRFSRAILAVVMVAVLVSSSALLAATAEVNRNSYLLGDTNGDFSVNLRDAVHIQKYVVKLIGADDFIADNADMNGDGKINVIDATYIQKYIVGLDVTFVDSRAQAEYAKEVLRLVNIERVNAGLTELELDTSLTSAANARAREIADVFDHKRPDGTSWSTVLSDYKLSYTAIGENIAAGYQTPEDVVQGWMESPGHKANILNSKYDKMGLGYYYNSTASYRSYWAQIFMQSFSLSNDKTPDPIDNPETDLVEWVPFKEYSLDEEAQAKNVILMIGDGMGENIINAAEIVKGEKLVMSGLPNTTYVATYSQSVIDGTAEFTDSAASATALSTGVKTYNKYIGVDKDGNKLETICEFAKGLGMKTGVVARHYVSHATPAGMAGHNQDRGNYRQLLIDMANSRVDVMFGGGQRFYEESKNTQESIAECGYKYIRTEEELLSLTNQDGKILGMFAYDNMLRAAMEPTLTTMTAKALELLENDDGFFLMVEGSNIDVCESQMDMDGTLEQMKAFDHTVDYVLNWAEQHPGTLVLVTADHETGGVQLPENATAADINNSCFTSGGEHTNTNVKLMAGGAQSKEICSQELIDNTDIANYMREVLSASHG